MTAPKDEPVHYEVGVGRCVLFYKEANRQLGLAVEHDEGPGRGILRICVEPIPRWYRPEDFSDIGPVPETELSRVLENIRASLVERLYQCVFQDREGNIRSI